MELVAQEYGSEKKGLPTTYFLTLAPEPVRVHADLSKVEFVAVQHPNAFLTGNPLHGLENGGTVYLQTSLPLEKVWASLTPDSRKIIRERKIHLWAVDAKKIAREVCSFQDLQMRMQGIVLLGAFLRLTPFRELVGLAEDELFSALQVSLTKYFGKRGDQVVADNLLAARRGFAEVQEVIPPDQEVPQLPLLHQSEMNPQLHASRQRGVSQFSKAC